MRKNENKFWINCSLTNPKMQNNVSVGSQIVAHTLVETGNGPNRPNTIDL